MRECNLAKIDSGPDWGLSIRLGRQYTLNAGARATGPSRLQSDASPKMTVSVGSCKAVSSDSFGHSHHVRSDFIDPSSLDWKQSIKSR